MAQLSTTLSKSIVRLRHHKLVTNAGVYVFGNIFRNSLAFFLIPVYTRFLTPEDYGITGLALAIGGVLIALLSFGIRGSIARYYYEYRDSPEQLKQFISTNFIFLILVGGSVTLALHLWGESLWLEVSSGQIPFSPYIRLVLWSSYAAVLSQIVMTLYQVQQRAWSYVTTQAAIFALDLSATILFVVAWRMGATGQLLGKLVAFGISGAVLSVFLLKDWFSPRLKWRYLQISLAFGLPLVPHALSSWIINSIDRLLLEPLIPLAELGRYNLGYQLGFVMSLLVGSINLAWSPYYFNLMEQSQNPEKRIVQVTSLYVGSVGGICLLGGMFSREILLLLTPEQYHAAAVYVPLILFSYLFNGYYFFVAMPIFYYKKTYLVPALTIFSALLNIGLNLWWIPYWGALGAAWATLAAFTLTLAVTYFLSQHWQKINYPLGKFAAINGLIFAGVLFVTYSGPQSVQLGVLIWKFIWVALFAVVVYVWLIKPNLTLLKGDL